MHSERVNIVAKILWIVIICLLLLYCNTPRYSDSQIAETYESESDLQQKKTSVAYVKDSEGNEKTLSYPYLTIRFKQHDTEMEMIVDPLETNVEIDLQRTPESSLEISSDSTAKDTSGATVFDVSETTDQNVAEGTTDDILIDLNRAQSYFYEGDYQQALLEVKKSIQKKPTASAYALGGSIFYVNGEIDKAISAWETALKLNPDMTDVQNILRQVKR